MTTWEYRLVQFPASDFRGLNTTKVAARVAAVETVLNALGAEGWEAVNLNVAGDYNGRILLKRPIPPR